MVDSQLPYITAGRLQPAQHNLLSHKYANHPRCSCHTRKYATTAPAAVPDRSWEFPHISHTLSPAPSSSFHSSPIHSHPRKTRHRCAHAPPRRRICRDSAEGSCSCDAAATWKDAFPTLRGVRRRTSPCHVWNVAVHSGRSTGKSMAASCAMSVTRPHGQRRCCGSCRGWGKC